MKRLLDLPADQALRLRASLPDLQDIRERVLDPVHDLELERIGIVRAAQAEPVRAQVLMETLSKVIASRRAGGSAANGRTEEKDAE